MTTRRGLHQAPATNDRCDVVIVGARVAGATTGLFLARAGHRVAIVDRAGPPADTTSTHALMRPGTLQLRRTGVLGRIIDAGTTAIREVNLQFDESKIGFPVAEAFGIDAYYAPRRTLLDSVLLDAAIEAGAVFYSGVSVTGVTRDRNHRVDGVTIRKHAEESQIPARWVVGADGTNSRIASAVGAQVRRYHPPSNAIVYAYFQDVESCGYDFRFVAHRNIGAIPTNDGLTLVFVGGPLAEAPQDGAGYLRETLSRLAPDLGEKVAAGEQIGRLYRATGVPSVLRDPAGPGWCLAGDAGFTEDPISAHGITDALRDGELCAEAIDRSLRDPGEEARAQAAYRATRDRFAIPLLEATLPLSSFAWDGPRASALLRGLGEISDAECEHLAERDRTLVGSA